MKKFLVSDFDGTFYNNGKDISYNIDMVKKFRKRNNLFAIATGRSLYDFTKKLEEFPIEYDYLIINHGATILDEEDNIIKNTPINNEIKENISKELKIKDSESIFVCKGLESRVSINEKEITKIHIRCSSQEEQENLTNILHTQYSEFVKSYLITGIDHCIEIISEKTDKAKAIKEIAQLKKIQENNIYTVGDSYNDIEMLEAFHGFCMGNSEELIKQKIKKQCTSVGKLIEKIMGETNEQL